MRERLPMFMVLLAALMWGTTGTARALGPADAAPLAVGAVRIAIGGGVLVLIAAARGSLRLSGLPLVPALIASGAVAVYQLSFFEGVARAGVAVGTIVAIGSAPLFAGLLGWLVLRESPTPRWLAATSVGVAGVALLSVPRSGVAFEPLALALPLIAGAGYATYATASKRMLRARDNVTVAAAAFGGGAVLLLPVLLLVDLSWLRTASGIAVALELGLVATALAYVLFTAALARLPVSWGATLSLAEPLTASVLGVWLLGETLAPLQLAGAGLVAMGLLALATGPAPS